MNSDNLLAVGSDLAGFVDGPDTRDFSPAIPEDRAAIWWME